MSNKDIALQIIGFLKSAVANKEINEDYVESIDVAIDCVADAFEVDKDDNASAAFDGKSLKEILVQFQVSAPLEVIADAESVPVHVEHDEDILKKADELKLEGNKAMARRDFQEAVDKYTEALKLTPNNVIFLSNRAAAYSSLRQHEQAIEDAKAAIAIDPSYSKAYSRLGLAYYALNKPKEAFDAYKKGVESEGDSPSESMKKGYETAKKRVEDSLHLEKTTPEPTDGSTPDSGAVPGAGGFPDLSNLASMLGGSGGLASLMNNPAIQQMMQDPNLMSNLMNNPALSQMAQNMGLGGGEGGIPDLESMMNNPTIRNMANQFMQGRGGSDNGSE